MIHLAQPCPYCHDSEHKQHTRDGQYNTQEYTDAAEEDGNMEPEYDLCNKQTWIEMKLR
jgi:hypothetical protein